MPETKGTLEAIEQWEEYPKELVKLGMAELVYDSAKERSPMFDVEATEESLEVVRAYHILVGSGINMLRVEWRFHYDKRPGAKSSLRVRKKGLKALLGSMTVNSVIQKLNLQIAGDNGYDFDKLKLIMEEAIKLVEDKKKQEQEQEIFDGK